MIETGLLASVRRYPHPAALARRTRDGSLFAGLERLEAQGLVTRRRGLYRLTQRGPHELSMARAVAQLVARSHRRDTFDIR